AGPRDVPPGSRTIPPPPPAVRPPVSASAGPKYRYATISSWLRILLDGVDRFVKGLSKLLHAFSFQSCGNIDKADIETIEALHNLPSLLHPLLDRTGNDVAVVEHGGDRLLRHRPDRHRGDQRLDIHQIGISRVLRAGARPQEALRARPPRAQGFPALRRECPFHALIGHLCIGDRDLAAQIAGAGFSLTLQQL